VREGGDVGNAQRLRKKLKCGVHMSASEKGTI
jgi:hypothetical protein